MSTDDDDTAVMDMGRVSEVSMKLAQLALRLGDAARRYADAVCHLDEPGEAAAELAWTTERDLESLGEIVHSTRQVLRKARREREGRSPTMETTPHTPPGPTGPTEPPEELPPPPEAIPEQPTPIPPGDPRPGLDGRE